MLNPKQILFTIFTLLLLRKCRPKDYCRPEFCNNSKQHILCKYKSEDPASTCLSYERTIFSETDKRKLLAKINSRRNKVAAGEIRSLPPAAGMTKLEWNSELEISAQRWADQCVKHDVPDLKDACRDLVNLPVGQNIATVQGDSPGLTPLALVDVWYMELLKFNSSVISRYVPSSETSESHYDYFTQLVWEESTEVGCGAVKFQERLDVKYRTVYRLVCNFAPAGNRRNKTVYSCGPPCSKCPDGVCDRDYTALCDHKSTKNDEYTENDSYEDTMPVETTALENKSEIIPTVLNTIKKAVETSTSDYSETHPLTFDFFSHLYDTTQLSTEEITSFTKDLKNRDALLNDFIELLKKKLSKDPTIQDLLSYTMPGSKAFSEVPFTDESVAAFINRIYHTKEFSTTVKTTPKDYVNSTLLVDLIEAVIFRSNDKISTTAVYDWQDTQTLPIIKPVKVQAELAEVKQNKEFTGHYFFPEEDDESSSITTESYYDNTNIAPSEVEIEIDNLKMSSMTRDFLDDIFETEATTEKIAYVPFDNGRHANNMRRNYLSQNMQRRRKKRHLRRSLFDNIECTYETTTLPLKCSRDPCKDNYDKKYVSYRVLLQKLASDLRILKLNENFHCAHNRSIEYFTFQSLLLIFIWLFLK